MLGKILNNSFPFVSFLIFFLYLIKKFFENLKFFEKGERTNYTFQLSCFFLLMQTLYLFLSVKASSVLDLSLTFNFSSYIFLLFLQFLSFWSLHISMESALVFPLTFRKIYKYTSYLILTVITLSLFYIQYFYLNLQRVYVTDMFFIGNRFPLEISTISGIQFLGIFVLWILELCFMVYCLKTGFKSTSKQNFTYFVGAFLLQASLVILKVFSLPPFEEALFLQIIKQVLFFYYLFSWVLFLHSASKNLEYVGYTRVKK